MTTDSGTYDQATILRRQKIAEAMLNDSMKPRKIEHWAQGLAQLGQAGVGGYMANQANEDAKAERAQQYASIAKMLGLPASDGSLPAAAPATPTSPAETSGQLVPPPAPITSSPLAPVASAMSPTPAVTPPVNAPRAEVMPSAKVWGDKEAEAAGLYEPSKTAPIKVASTAPTVPVPQAPVAQAMTPPQMPAAVPAPAAENKGSGVLINATPQQKAAIAVGLQSPEGSPARAIAMSMMTQLMKPQEFGFQNQPDGTILRTNPRTGTVEPVYQGATKPTFGDTGEVDPQTGQPVKGFIDPTKQTVTPYKPQPTTPAQPSTIPPVPAGVDPKVWRESQSKRVTEDAMPADTKVTSALRNEIQGLPSYKNLAQAAPVYKAMSEAAGRDNRAADLNLIYGFGKIMDPGSVVRESEMTMAEKINTLPQYLRATAESQLSGSGRLSPEVRAQILEEAHTRIQSYKGLFDQDSGMYRGIAKRGRMNEEDVIPSFGEFPSWTPPKAAAPVEIDGYKIRAK